MSPTQKLIADLLLSDLTIKGIARELDMSQKAVSCHLDRMRTEYGKRTTMGLAIELDRRARGQHAG